MTDDAATRLKPLRERIRAIDDQLLELIAERMRLARDIGALKLAQNLPVKDYKVEKVVLAANLAKAAEVGLYGEMAEAFTRLLIRYSVEAQDDLHAKNKKRHAGSKVIIAGGRGRMGQWLTEFFESFGHDVQPFDLQQTTSLADTCAHADVVILSTPISTTASLIEQLTKAKTKALVFDICSLKTPLLASIRAAVAAGLKITSVHPMFGPSAEFLAGRNILVCHAGHAGATSAARALFADTTASLAEIPLERHDELMGAVLGLSHMTSLVFAEALATSGLTLPELQGAASTTFNAQLGVTAPVAAENPDLYFEIQAANAFTPTVLQGFRDALDAYAKAIASGDRSAFKTLMAKGRRFLHGEAP